MGKGKKNASSVALRQQDIEEMLLRGKSTSFIVAFCLNEYGIARSTVEKDLTIIYGYLRKYFEKAKDDIIAEHIAKYDRIFEQCSESYNYRDALKAMRQKEELLKFHRNEPLIAVQNNTLNLENVTDQQLLKAIEELTGKRNVD
jgi:hypothetical protein